MMMLMCGGFVEGILLKMTMMMMMMEHWPAHDLPLPFPFHHHHHFPYYQVTLITIRHFSLIILTWEGFRTPLESHPLTIILLYITLFTNIIIIRLSHCHFHHSLFSITWEGFRTPLESHPLTKDPAIWPAPIIVITISKMIMMKMLAMMMIMMMNSWPSGLPLPLS